MTNTEAAAAVRRYNAMTERNPPAIAWTAIGIRLWTASHSLTGDAVTFVRDRANDAHARADCARRTGAGYRRAS